MKKKIKIRNARDSGDILDRLSIADLKNERIGTEDNKKEYHAFLEEFNNIKKIYPEYNWDQFYRMLKKINSYIWSLEADLKGDKEHLKNPLYLDDEINKEVMVKMGKNSILIRNFNSLRVEFKNIINKLVGEGFQDIKSHHLSEGNFYEK